MAGDVADHHSTGPNVLAIGWDGADATVVRQLLSAGRLPNLSSLLDRGSWTGIEGFAGLGDDAHWSSFATGQPPGSHGRFHFEQAPHGTYNQTMILRDDPNLLPTFWSQLASQGITASILDVPKAPYASTPGVAEVVDWMPHGADADELSASSSELAELCAAHRPHAAFRECYSVAGPNGLPPETHLRRIDDRRAARTSALCEWVAARSDALTLAVYASCHCVGHGYTHLHDVSGDDPLSVEFERLDTDLGRVISAWGGPPENVVVFSLTGMGLATTARLETEATVRALNRRWLRANPRFGAVSAAKHAKARVRTRGAEPLPSADAFRCMKFVAPATAVRVNLQGRDPRGIIPANRFKPVLDWLADRLRELVDDNGTPVLSEVLFTADEFKGERHDALADLIAVWATDRPGPVHTSVTSVEACDYTNVERVRGDHVPGGWMVCGQSLQTPTDEIAVDKIGEQFCYWLRSRRSSAERNTGPRLETE